MAFTSNLWHRLAGAYTLSGGSTNTITIAVPSNSVMRIRSRANAIYTGTSNEVAFQERVALYKNIAGTLTLPSVGAQPNDDLWQSFCEVDVTGFSIAHAISGTNAIVQIKDTNSAHTASCWVESDFYIYQW